MNGVTIYKCSSEFTEFWWVPLEKAGFVVEHSPSHGIVKSGNAKVAVHPMSDGHLMVVFSAPLVVLGKNLRLAKQVDQIFLRHGVDAPPS